MPTLAETACCRCREQKLKCSRERPTCARCLRLGFQCAFPAPPDRKLLAALRTPAKRRRVDEYSPYLPEADVTVAGGSNRTAASAIVVDTERQENRRAPQQQPAPSTPTTADPRDQTCPIIIKSLPEPLQRFLIDIFFSHMYNASLLLHKPTLLKDFDAGSIPAHVLVSLFASATIFLKPQSPLYKANYHVLEGLGDLGSRGKLWAQTAGREALQTIDLPCLDTLRTCQLLALYWFSAGQSRQNTMFSGIAYKAACVLGLDQVKQRRHNKADDPAADSAAWLGAESKRRLFWATWLTNCINSEHYTVGTSVNDRILNLGLPESEILYQNPPIHLLPTITMQSIDEASAVNQTRGTASVMAELVQLMRIWAAIGDYFAGNSKKPSHQRLAELFSLDQRLQTWSRNLHPSMVYSKRNLYKQLVVDQQPSYVFVHALHYQCCLVLHVSMVPQFSGLPTDHSVSPEIVKASAMVALRNARAISKLCSDLIALDWDFPRLAPFIGYCIYVSASIHIVFLFLDNDRLAHLARTQLVSNLRVLRVMKDYWSNLERLWARIHILFDAQTAQMNNDGNNNGAKNRMSDPEMYLDPLEEGTEDHEISVLARQSRNPGKLQEPLSNSVLKYHLELRPVEGSSPEDTSSGSSLQDIERLIYTDVLGRVANRDSARRFIQKQQQQQQQQLPSCTGQAPTPMGLGETANILLDLQAGSSLSAHPNNATSPDMLLGLQSENEMAPPSIAERSGDDISIDMLDALPYFMQGDSDGWQMGINSLTDTMLSHGDLFF